jgi:hypothetical protein
MEKNTISAGVRGERVSKPGLENGFDINALRKPLKMTATLKRRALKKKLAPHQPERACGQ